MDLSNRSYEKELLDRANIPFPDIKRNMKELNFINTYLGGHSITIDGINALLSNSSFAAKDRVLICEIGCGGGDNLKAISQWCKRKGVNASFIGIDINMDCIDVAFSTCRELPASFMHSDYKDVHFERPPAIIFSSLFCHHFSNDELIFMLQWMKKNSTLGFFVNDLHRHLLAYHSIKWLSKVFSKSYLVKNDAPLSVARGFKRKEWISLLSSAGIHRFNLRWKWAFRWLLVVNHNEVSSLHREV